MVYFEAFYFPTLPLSSFSEIQDVIYEVPTGQLNGLQTFVRTVREDHKMIQDNVIFGIPCYMANYMIHRSLYGPQTTTNEKIVWTQMKIWTWV